MEQIDAFRRPERFEKFLLAAEADARGRPGFEDKLYEQGDFFRRALIAANTVDAQTLIAEGFQHKKLAEKIQQERIKRISALTK